MNQRINDPDRPVNRPRNITPWAIGVGGVIIGMMAGIGIAWVMQPNSPASDCANVIRTANNIIDVDDQIFVAFAISADPTDPQIKLLKAQRKGYMDFYDQNKGVCE